MGILQGGSNYTDSPPLVDMAQTCGGDTSRPIHDEAAPERGAASVTPSARYCRLVFDVVLDAPPFDGVALPDDPLPPFDCDDVALPDDPLAPLDCAVEGLAGEKMKISSTS